MTSNVPEESGSEILLRLDDLSLLVNLLFNRERCQHIGDCKPQDIHCKMAARTYSAAVSKRLYRIWDI